MKSFRRTIILFFLTALCANLGTAQTFSAPRQEKLLNGLKLLVWRDAAAPKVTIKLRIHNGAAFDPKDKMGTMALLSDILFPNIDDTKEYFAEDLSGSLDVAYNYDYIELSATGTPDKAETILDAFANAVTQPPITPENFALVRGKRLAKVKELEKNPAYIADRAVAQKLFGDFPYGRSVEGTSTSLSKIDKADLMLARERFFTSDNATLAVIGNVDADETYRLSRRLFGAWEKADQKVPATFRQPDAPTAGNFFVEAANYDKAEIYQATRGVARNGKDYPASLILADVLTDRFRNAANNLNAQISTDSQSHLLFGTFLVKASLPAANATAFTNKAHNAVNIQLISDAEFQKNRAVEIAAMTNRLSDKSQLAELWLDADTYKLPGVAQQFKDLQNVTLADVNNVLNNVVKNSPFVAVAVGDATKLKDFVETGKAGVK